MLSQVLAFTAMLMLLADAQNVTVDEDRNKNTISLRVIVCTPTKPRWKQESWQGGRRQSNRGQSNRCSANSRTAWNETIAPTVDDTIEDNYKAALISNRLDKEPTRFEAKNAVLTLRGESN